MVLLTDYKSTKKVIYQAIKDQGGGWGNPIATATLHPDSSEKLSRAEFGAGMSRMIADGLMTQTKNGLFVWLTRRGENEARVG